MRSELTAQTRFRMNLPRNLRRAAVMRLNEGAITSDADSSELERAVPGNATKRYAGRD